jgi:hypothetical protein
MKTFLSKYGNAIWIILLIPACFIAFFQGAHSGQAAPLQLTDGMTVEWSSGGWVFTCTSLDTSTKSGTEITFTADGEWTRDGIVCKTESIPVTISVGESTLKKTYTSSIALTGYKVESTTGSGGATIGTDGKLTWWITAKNDGTTNTFSFKLVPVTK